MPWKGGSIICNIIFKSTYQSLSPFLFSFSLPSESLYIHVISSISEFGPKFWSLLFMYVLDILQRLCLNPVNTFYCWVRQIKLLDLRYAFNLSIIISNIKLFPSSHQFSLVKCLVRKRSQWGELHDCTAHCHCGSCLSTRQHGSAVFSTLSTRSILPAWTR